MEMNVIESLRPVAQTAVEIRRSMDKVQGQRLRFTGELEAANRQKGTLLLEGTRKDIIDNIRIIASLEDSITELDAMLSVLAEGLVQAAKNEKVTLLLKQVEDTCYEDDCKKLASRFATEYPAAANVIASLLDDEAKILNKRRLILNLVEQLTELGCVDMPNTSSPSQIFTGNALRANSFGELVRLPGVRGAPEVKRAFVTMEVVRLVPNHVYNETLRKVVVNGEKEHREEVTEARPVVEDQPFWWPGCHPTR